MLNILINGEEIAAIAEKDYKSQIDLAGNILENMRDRLNY